MSRTRPTTFGFVAHDDAELLAQMTMVQAGGTGWINVEPVIEEDHQPPEPGPVRLPRGIDPQGAGHHLDAGQARRGAGGQGHDGGPAARRPGPTWRGDCATSDSRCPRGGASPRTTPAGAWWLEVPADADNRVVIDWLLRAAAAVCQVQATGRWEAAVHPGLA